MSAYEEAVNEWIAASRAEKYWKKSDGPLGPIMDRRNAATRRLHQLESAWQPCECHTCTDMDSK